MEPKVHRFRSVLTVKELKAILEDWPETKEDGEPTEVWMDVGFALSGEVIEIWPLDMRGDSADILFKCEKWKTREG